MPSRNKRRRPLNGSESPEFFRRPRRMSWEGHTDLPPNTSTIEAEVSTASITRGLRQLSLGRLSTRDEEEFSKITWAPPGPDALQTLLEERTAGLFLTKVLQSRTHILILGVSTESYAHSIFEAYEGKIFVDAMEVRKKYCDDPFVDIPERYDLIILKDVESWVSEPTMVSMWVSRHLTQNGNLEIHGIHSVRLVESTQDVGENERLNDEWNKSPVRPVNWISAFAELSTTRKPEPYTRLYTTHVRKRPYGVEASNQIESRCRLQVCQVYGFQVGDQEFNIEFFVCLMFVTEKYGEQVHSLPATYVDQLPLDLRDHLNDGDVDPGKEPDDVEICASPPAPVEYESEEFIGGHYTAYFPRMSVKEMLVVVHFPGGICKNEKRKDHSWCSSLAQATGTIHVSLDYPTAPQSSFQQIQCDCQSFLEYIRQRCEGRWKEVWNTSKDRIVVGGSSIGATLAIIVAAIASNNNESIQGLILLVPVIDTNSDPEAIESGPIIGLTPRRLLSDLDRAFARVPERDKWWNNPRNIPKHILGKLPPIIMVVASLDFLRVSSIEFGALAHDAGVSVELLEAEGLHMVKDMDQRTAAGRKVKAYIEREMVKLVSQTVRN